MCLTDTAMLLLLQCQNNIMCVTDIKKHFLPASVLVRHNRLPSGLQARRRQLMAPDQLHGKQAVSCCLFSTLYTVKTMTLPEHPSLLLWKREWIIIITRTYTCNYLKLFYKYQVHQVMLWATGFTVLRYCLASWRKKKELKTTDGKLL